MRATVRLFAACRDRARTDVTSVELDGAPTAKRLKEALAAAHPELAPILPYVRVAVNLAFASDDDPIRETDELALIPPVSGGVGLGPFVVGPEPLAAERVTAAAKGPEIGAVVTFEGTVRNQTGPHAVGSLEYEAYKDMAEAFLRKIGDEIREKWPEARVSIEHRTGKLEIGETAVVISVGTPHRADAFEACRYAIERIKQDVPIWKKEARGDGSVWVGLGS